MNVKRIDMSSLAGYALVAVLVGAGPTDGLAQVSTTNSSAPDKVIVFLAGNCGPNCLKASMQFSSNGSDVALRTADGHEARTFLFTPTGDLKKHLEQAGANCNPNCLGHVRHILVAAGPRPSERVKNVDLQTRDGVRVPTIFVPVEDSQLP